MIEMILKLPFLLHLRNHYPSLVTDSNFTVALLEKWFLKGRSR